MTFAQTRTQALTTVALVVIHVRQVKSVVTVLVLLLAEQPPPTAVVRVKI